jgi:hypothetical protein
MKESEQYYKQIRREQAGWESDLLSSLLDSSEELKDSPGSKQISVSAETRFY